jgi:CRISPR system Cascade subunit CasA
VTRLLAARSSILALVPAFGKKRELGLLWVEPWDGNSSLSIEELDPFFIEICRRVRLTRKHGRIVGLGAGSECARIATSKEMKGVTGDPWAPIDRGENKVLSTTRDGFGYTRMIDLLDRTRYDRPPLAEIDQGDAARGLTILATALARGQGKTEGFHARRIPVSNSIARRLIGAQATDEFAKLGRKRIEEISDFTRKVLRPSLLILFQGGDADFRNAISKSQVDPWVRFFDEEIDRVFFDELFAEYEARVTGEHARADAENRSWREKIRGIGRNTFDRATDAAPRNAAHWYRARACSRSYFENRAMDILQLAKIEARHVAE